MSCLSNDLRLSSRIPSKAPFLGVGLHIIYQNPHEFSHLPTRADNHERETQCNSFRVTLEMSILCLNKRLRDVWLCLLNDLRLSSRIPSKAPFLGVGLHIIYQNPHEFSHLPTRADNHERETQCNSFKVTLEMSILCLNILMVTLFQAKGSQMKV